MQDDKIYSGKQFADFASDLQEEEIQKAWVIMLDINQRYRRKSNTSSNLDQLREEVLHRMAAIGILAEVDPAPCLYGEPPIVNILGKVSGDPIHSQGFDHERKAFEVKQATQRGEDYLGQKGRTKKPKKK